MENRVFKSSESRDAIRSRYNQILSVFPFGQRYIDTSFGRTFLLEAGDPRSPALVLLHGSCSNSAFWFGEMSALSPMYHVLAVDIIGEAGNSEENRLDLGGDGYADWLKEVLDALFIERAAVMGNSLGSWMALKFAAKYPGCVTKLVLIAPSGLSAVNAEFLEKAKDPPRQSGDNAIDPSVTQGIKLLKEVEEFISLIFQGYNPITTQLPVFSDEQLLRLRMPILFVAGKNDVLIDTPTAAQRLRTLIPRAQIHLLESVGHVVLNSLEYAAPFLAKEDKE